MTKHIYLLISLVGFFTPSLLSQESLTCFDFKEGTFIIPSQGQIPETTIMRRGNQQTEIITFNGKRRESVIDLKWLNDCSYTVILNKEVKPSHELLMKELEEMTITVKILSVEANCATFSAEGDGIGKGIVYTSTICKEETL